MKYPLLLCDFNEINFSRQVLKKVSKIKFHQNPSGGSQVILCRQTDGYMDMPKVPVTFRNFAHVHKKQRPYGMQLYLNITLPSLPRSFKLSLSFRLPQQNTVHISLLSHTCHVSSPSLPNNA